MLDILFIAVSGYLATSVYIEMLGEDMLLERLGNWLQDGTWWKYPLGGCNYCTTPYITAIMGVLYLFAWQGWAVVTTLSLAMFLTKINNNYELLQ